MTIEETIKYLKHNNTFNIENPEDVDVISCTIDALEKQDKYKWHDIKKNPNDLPSNDNTWIIVESKLDPLDSCFYAAWKGYILCEPSCQVNANITRWRYLDIS